MPWRTELKPGDVITVNGVSLAVSSTVRVAVLTLCDIKVDRLNGQVVSIPAPKVEP